MSHKWIMTNIYKINAGELTEKDLDIIVISLCHLKAKCMYDKSTRELMKDQLKEIDATLDKILGRL